jgi:hypothetical protein
MTLAAYRNEKFVADVASNMGWFEFCDWARKQGEALAVFADEGYTEDAVALAAQLEKKRKIPAILQSTAAALLLAARQCAPGDVLIVSDGMGD